MTGSRDAGATVSRLASRLMSRLITPAPGPFFRKGHIPGLRTAKTTVAAVAAYIVADMLNTSTQPLLAPLTALLVVQLTMYETVAHGLQRVGSVLAGVLVALGVARFVGLTWWSLGGLIAISLVVGMILRLGPQLLEVPISAMLVLGVSGREAVAFGRVYETLVGAGVGVFVNFVIAPPLYVRPAGDAIGELAERMARLLRGLAESLRTDWSRAAADRWLNESRELGAEVARADRSLERAEQSGRLNPRAVSPRARLAQPRLRIALTGLEHCYVSTRNLCRALFDRTFYLPEAEQAEAYNADIRLAVSDVLECAATALRDVSPIAEGFAPADEARADIEKQLTELHNRRDRLAELLLVDPYTDQAAWQQHGALLAAVDRLRVELEAAVRPSNALWRPAIISDRQKHAIRRVMDAAAQAATEFQPFIPQPQLDDRSDWGTATRGVRPADRSKPDAAGHAPAAGPAENHTRQADQADQAHQADRTHQADRSGPTADRAEQADQTGPATDGTHQADRSGPTADRADGPDRP